MMRGWPYNDRGGVVEEFERNSWCCLCSYHDYIYMYIYAISSGRLGLLSFTDDCYRRGCESLSQKAFSSTFLAGDGLGESRLH